jgi:hypothetical protein
MIADAEISNYRASGGATRRRPLNGWSSNDVEAIFSTEPGKPGQQSGGGSPSRHEHSKLGPSKIAGLTVGIVLILAIVLGIYWFVCYKRRGYKRRGPDNFLSEQDSMQVSGLPHWNIEPGCLDELPEDHEREISNSGAVTLLLADRHPIEQVYPS